VNFPSLPKGESMFVLVPMESGQPLIINIDQIRGFRPSSDNQKTEVQIEPSSGFPSRITINRSLQQVSQILQSGPTTQTGVLIIL
jgi:hypothetical protein